MQEVNKKSKGTRVHIAHKQFAKLVKWWLADKRPLNYGEHMPPLCIYGIFWISCLRALKLLHTFSPFSPERIRWKKKVVKGAWEKKGSKIYLSKESRIPHIDSVSDLRQASNFHRSFIKMGIIIILAVDIRQNAVLWKLWMTAATLNESKALLFVFAQKI